MTHFYAFSSGVSLGPWNTVAAHKHNLTININNDTELLLPFTKKIPTSVIEPHQLIELIQQRITFKQKK